MGYFCSISPGMEKCKQINQRCTRTHCPTTREGATHWEAVGKMHLRAERKTKMKVEQSIPSLGTFAVRQGFPCGSDVKESACNAGDLGSILGSGRSPGKGNGYPLQYPCLENSMDKSSHIGRGKKLHKDMEGFISSLADTVTSRSEAWDFPGGPVVKPLCF